MAFDKAEYQRELDESLAGVIPDDAEASQRLEEGEYPY
jgi:hypothetical protein